VKSSGLAALVAALGLAAALSACGSNSPGLYTPVRPIALPPGYQRIGGVGQGLYLGVPKSWTVFDLAAQSPTQALMKLLQKLPPGDSNVASEVEYALSADGSVHAVYAVDLDSAASSPGHFATSLSAYCRASGTSLSGRVGMPFLHRIASKMGRGVHDVRETDVRIGTVSGLEITLSENSSIGTLYTEQLDALPSAGSICLIDLAASGALPTGVASKVARTVQYL
jgi:hypothetical protein